ncbi:MAG: SRPBCC domain-containing protein [Thermoanaerobaculia bacterium]|nr:SRPBCC domain-containing protein [Thermoanaerobaculia bacterium]
MNEQKAEIAPVVVNTVVGMPAEDAFRLFTEGFADWWPLQSHSIAQGKSKSCAFEANEGGEIYEITEDDETHLWGTVSECVMPHRLVFSWHPGREAATAQEIEVLFDSDGEVTHVELVHSGWDNYGDGAEAMRDNYDGGWQFVLATCYRNAALRKIA